MDKEASPSFSILFFERCVKTNFSFQLWSSSPRCIFYWSSWRSGVTKQSTTENFNPWYWDHDKEETGQHLGETHPMSESTGASKIWHESRQLWERGLCLHSFPTNTKEGPPVGAFGTFLPCFTFAWFRRCKIRSQFIKSYLLPILVNEWDTKPTVIKEVNYFISFKVRWYPAVGYNEISWLSNRSWFFLERIKNFRDQKFPVRMDQWPAQNSKHRSSRVSYLL